MWPKIILLFALWFLWRFASRLIRAPRRRAQKGAFDPRRKDARTRKQAKDMEDLTRQDISDADFEEIP